MTNENKNQYNKQIKQKNQQAEANKIKASGRFATPNVMNSMNEEFGSETDFNQIKQKNQQAEANKNQASGRFLNNENDTK